MDTQSQCHHLKLQEAQLSIKEIEATLPQNYRLHLFLERPQSSVSKHGSSSMNQFYETHVIHSKTVNFKNCDHQGPELLSNGFALFNMNSCRSNLHNITSSENPSSSSVPSVPSTSANPSCAPVVSIEDQQKQKEELIKEIQDSFDTCITEFQVSSMFSWFPGKPPTDNSSSSPSNGQPPLVIVGSVANHLHKLDNNKVLAIYRAFFKMLHNSIKNSDHKKRLIRQNKWNGKFFYSSFTPPWFREILAVNAECIYIHPEKKVCVPDQKSLRSALGTKRALFVLSAFFENEHITRRILRKIVFQLSGEIIPLPISTSQHATPVQVQPSNTSSATVRQLNHATNTSAATVPPLSNPATNPPILNNSGSKTTALSTENASTQQNSISAAEQSTEIRQENSSSVQINKRSDNKRLSEHSLGCRETLQPSSISADEPISYDEPLPNNSPLSPQDEELSTELFTIRTDAVQLTPTEPVNVTQSGLGQSSKNERAKDTLDKGRNNSFENGTLSVSKHLSTRDSAKAGSTDAGTKLMPTNKSTFKQLSADNSAKATYNDARNDHSSTKISTPTCLLSTNSAKTSSTDAGTKTLSTNESGKNSSTGAGTKTLSTNKSAKTGSTGAGTKTLTTNNSSKARSSTAGTKTLSTIISSKAGSTDPGTRTLSTNKSAKAGSTGAGTRTLTTNISSKARSSNDGTKTLSTITSSKAGSTVPGTRTLSTNKSAKTGSTDDGIRTLSTYNSSNVGSTGAGTTSIHTVRRNTNLLSTRSATRKGKINESEELRELRLTRYQRLLSNVTANREHSFMVTRKSLERKKKEKEKKLEQEKEKQLELEKEKLKNRKLNSAQPVSILGKRTRSSKKKVHFALETNNSAPGIEQGRSTRVTRSQSSIDGSQNKKFCRHRKISKL